MRVQAYLFSIHFECDVSDRTRMIIIIIITHDRDHNMCALYLIRFFIVWRCGFECVFQLIRTNKTDDPDLFDYNCSQSVITDLKMNEFIGFSRHNKSPNGWIGLLTARILAPNIKSNRNMITTRNEWNQLKINESIETVLRKKMLNQKRSVNCGLYLFI